MDVIKAAITEKRQINFAVTDPRKSFGGYTVYRLQLKTYRNDNDNQPKAEFIGWKRFNDFKKLHKSLKLSFPLEFRSGYNDFVKGHFFGRFDEAVIEERRQASLRLLSFIALYPEMLMHSSFQLFLENDVKNTDESSRGKTSSMSSSEDLERRSPIDCGDELNEDGNTNTINNNDELDGLLSLQQMTVVEDGEEPEAPEDEVFINVENGSSVDDGRQSWLREARSLCGDDLESLASEAADEFPITPRTSVVGEDSVLFGEPLDEDILCDPPLSSVSQDEAPDDSKAVTKPAAAEVINEGINRLTASKENISEFQDKLQVDEKMSAIISKTVEEDDYIFQASVAMSNAIEQEELGNVEAAFDMYKFGIGLLLCGVQTDTNVDRREAVRRKTAQYLLRAETLYNSNILPDTKKIEKTDLSKTTMSLDNKWRFRLSDVKVIGVIDKVMLVQKIFSQTDDVFIMKVLHKQGAEYKRTSSSKKGNKSQRNLYNCRFMAFLTNCVETKTGIYLLLEYVAGGRLWDYLGMPVFSNRRQSSYNSASEATHLSWNSNDHNTASNHEENIDIVDIPSTKYVRQGSDALSSRPRSVSIACKIKRSPSNSARLDEDCVKIWAAQIALALIDLHTKGVLCRDLNPRNILLDAQGNIKLTYFSNVDGTDDTLDENAVNFLYTSPEADGVFEPTSSTDWWSFGALLFELLTGDALFTCHPNGINQRSVITLPRRVSNEACSLLAGLLKYHPKERLGSGPTGNEEIKAHPFFHGIDWESLKQTSQRVSR